MDARRAKLERLSAVIRNVTENPSLADDREFEDRLQQVVDVTRQLFESAEAATSAERSPLEILGDLEVSGDVAAEMRTIGPDFFFAITLGNDFL